MRGGLAEAALGFALYVEFSPSTSGIWLRPDDPGRVPFGVVLAAAITVGRGQQTGAGVEVPFVRAAPLHPWTCNSAP